VQIDQRSTQIVFTVEEPPQFVLVDAGMHLLAELEQSQTDAQWLAQLRGAERAIDRLRAAEALASFSGAAVIEGLRAAVDSDGFHAVRSRAAEPLGTIGNDDAQRTLLASWTVEKDRHDSDPRVRQALLGGLARAKAPLGPQQLALIIDALEHDPSDHVRAAAATALARFDGTAEALADKQARRQAEKLRNKAIKALRKGLEAHSFHEEVEQASALALGEIGTGKEWALLLDTIEPVRPTFLRLAGVDALLRMRAREGVLDPAQRAELATVVVGLLDDPNMRVRKAVVDDIAELGLPDGKEYLRRVTERELDTRIRSLAEDELRSL
jgi:hypothetical protein